VRRGASLPIVHRFSALAVPTVGAMALAGAVLAVVQIRSPSALLTTSYGQVFLTKMAGVCLLLGLATLNRQRLTPALAKSDGSRNLVRSIASEMGLAIAILGLVAIWRFTPPPRALMAAATEPVSLHIHTAPAMVEVTLRPGRVGHVKATLVLMTGDFGPLDPKEVSLALANPEAGIEDIQRRADRSADGTWHVDDLIVPLPGRWRVRVEALVTDFDRAILEGQVDIRP